jgi:predicted transcriptional regulator
LTSSSGSPRNRNASSSTGGCPPELLERIERARLTREKADAELAVLVDRAVGMGIGWPEIAARLGVTRQAARQHYQRRHRHGASRQDRAA